MGPTLRSLLCNRRTPWVILALALGVRAAYLLQIDASPLFAYPAVDADTYAQHAFRLAAGNWLGRGEGPFWQPPRYPYFLGLVKVLFPESFFYAARWLQALLGAFSCALIYWFGSQVFQRATLQAYQETLKANPRHLQACTELIGFYLQAGDIHNAEAILQQAVKYYPEQEGALRYMYESIKARILTGGRAR